MDALYYPEVTPKSGNRPPKHVGLGPTARPSPRTPATSVNLPLAYMRILETEATRLGIRRGAFLTLLIKRKIGEVTLERPKDAPEYKFTDKELNEAKLFLWYIAPDIRKLVDKDRIQMGLSSTTAWITQTLNHWIGRPLGLRHPLS